MGTGTATRVRGAIVAVAVAAKLRAFRRERRGMGVVGFRFSGESNDSTVGTDKTKWETLTQRL
jgi:hypothetical protein